MKPVTALLALLNGALLATLAWLCLVPGQPLQWAPVAAAPATAEQLPALRPLLPLPEAQLAMTWQHPLFSPDRQPDLGKAAPASTGLEGLSLGAIIRNGPLQWALLRGHDQHVFKLKLGDALGPPGGWVLQQLTATRATFERQGQTQTLTLPMPRLPAPDAAPVSRLSHVTAP